MGLSCRRVFRTVAWTLLGVGFALCFVHASVSCVASGHLATIQLWLILLAGLPAVFFRCWGILAAVVALFLIVPMFAH